MLRLIVAVVFAAAAQADYRILSGAKVKIEDYPYQAVVLYDLYQIGAGAIISPWHILTAAHLNAGSKSISNFKVQVGTAKYMYGPFLSVRSFDSYAKPSEKGMPTDDLAVITLKNPINFTDCAQPIAIVPERQEPKHGEMLTATGWGGTESRPFSRELLMARLPCIERAICSEAWKARSRGEVQLKNNTLCAGGGITSTFIGDSGGPLVNDKNQLVGIVSWGKNKKSLLGYPGIFVNLADADMQKFIHTHMSEQ